MIGIVNCVQLLSGQCQRRDFFVTHQHQAIFICCARGVHGCRRIRLILRDRGQYSQPVAPTGILSWRSPSGWLTEVLPTLPAVLRPLVDEIYVPPAHTRWLRVLRRPAIQRRQTRSGTSTFAALSQPANRALRRRCRSPAPSITALVELRYENQNARSLMTGCRQRQCCPEL